MIVMMMMMSHSRGNTRLWLAPRCPGQPGTCYAYAGKEGHSDMTMHADIALFNNRYVLCGSSSHKLSDVKLPTSFAVE